VAENGGAGTARVVLPEASPEQYLRWMAFWREVEQKVGERPSLQTLAAREAAPFLGDPVADYLSSTVSEIAHQASAARDQGRAAVAPEVEGPPDLLIEASSYVARRGAWLSQFKVAEAMGIDPLEPELVELRRRVVEAIRNQLSEEP
jgi:hypothetical protein